MAVGGFIAGLVLSKQDEHRDEADAQALLQGAGLSEQAADGLNDLTSDRRNLGPFITQVAPYVLGPHKATPESC